MTSKLDPIRYFNILQSSVIIINVENESQKTLKISFKNRNPPSLEEFRIYSAINPQRRFTKSNLTMIKTNLEKYGNPLTLLNSDTDEIAAPYYFEIPPNVKQILVVGKQASINECNFTLV
nr:hypothetical protein [Abalone asfa-like virus]